MIRLKISLWIYAETRWWWSEVWGRYSTTSFVYSTSRLSDARFLRGYTMSCSWLALTGARVRMNTSNILCAVYRIYTVHCDLIGRSIWRVGSGTYGLLWWSLSQSVLDRTVVILGLQTPVHASAWSCESSLLCIPVGSECGQCPNCRSQPRRGSDQSRRPALIRSAPTNFDSGSSCEYPNDREGTIGFSYHRTIMIILRYYYDTIILLLWYGLWCYFDCVMILSCFWYWDNSI